MYYLVISINKKKICNPLIPKSRLIYFACCGVAPLEGSGRRDQLRGAATMQAK